MDSDIAKMLSEALQQIYELNNKVDQLQQQLSGVNHISGWASPTDAAIALKPDGVMSVSHLRDLRLRGAFSESRKEIRKAGRRWEYNIEKCRPALASYFRRQAAS